MEIYQGKSVFAGIAIGKILVWKRGEREVVRRDVEDVDRELRRLSAALSRMTRQLKTLYQTAVSAVGERDAMIFDGHLAIAEDPALLERIRGMIREQHVNAEYAAAQAGAHYAALFEAIPDDYMRERAGDVRDITDRLIAILQGRQVDEAAMEQGTIIVAEDLTPSETMQMNREKVGAFVVRLGAPTSHTAILARSMNLPALIQTPYENRIDGHLAIVDGIGGSLIVDPDEETLRDYRGRLRKEQEKARLLLSLKGLGNLSRSGRRMEIYANAACIEDIDSALQNDAHGIGLFRSEFVYLGKETYPTEEEQFRIYREALQRMEGREVVIRTLDIGADKKAPYFGIAPEANPALGYRAIRICLQEPELFRTQLRALLRAASYGRLAIMYPMICTLEEVRAARACACRARRELEEEGCAVPSVREGIMIETPAAVMISDLLAKESDFFSIGTNDLTQYTLAVDRQNDKVNALFDPHNESVLRMIELTAKNAHAAGIPVGICGELGSDTGLTGRFLSMGIDEVSVSPAMVLPVRKALREND
ncbi:MAG: phosphoenolpyruvate--protein phosphotransferase [Eubacteriales bacterium]|nr:phosphoenolpyruvate--protein phosphotransferase [Eubacteriales bacterium]